MAEDMKIPHPFVWDESFKVFYDNLDEEHRQLFKCVFTCCETNNADSLNKLIETTVNHFSEEEGMMDTAKYADVVAHKKLHAEFVAKIKALKAPLDDGTLNFAKDWLVKHIKGVDFKYKGKLQAK